MRAYPLPHQANEQKLDSLRALYQAYATEYRYHVRRLWADFSANRLELIPPRPVRKGNPDRVLTTTYQQIAGDAAATTLLQHQQHLADKIRLVVQKSRLDPITKHQLHSINTQFAWLRRTATYIPSKGAEPVAVPNSTLRLMRKLYAHVSRQRVRFPRLDHPRLLLDQRVAILEPAKAADHFSHWLRVSTLTKGQRISLPVKPTAYCQVASGDIAKTFELRLADDGQLRLTLFKKSGRPTVEPNAAGETVAFDVGLRTLLAASTGELLGQRWLTKLLCYDREISDLARARQKLSLKVSSRRYQRLMTALRGFVKSEVGRVLNRYFARHSVQRVVLEKLDFTNPNLSKRMNRILRNFGQGVINTKLESLAERLGFELVHVNPAYTSKGCRHCHYVADSNRKQDVFRCGCCGHQEQADTHASRHLVERFHDKQGAGADALGVDAVLSRMKQAWLAGLNGLLRRGVVCRLQLPALVKRSRWKQLSVDEARGLVPAMRWAGA